MPDLDMLRNHLILLSYEFDKAILDGKSFAEVKKMFSEIKSLQRAISDSAPSNGGPAFSSKQDTQRL